MVYNSMNDLEILYFNKKAANKKQETDILENNYHELSLEQIFCKYKLI